MSFLIDLRGERADGDESPTAYVVVTLCGSVATMADIHSILAGAEADADALRQDDPGRDTALPVTLFGQLREALEAEEVVAVRLAARLAEQKAAVADGTGEKKPARKGGAG